MWPSDHRVQCATIDETGSRSVINYYARREGDSVQEASGLGLADGSSAHPRCRGRVRAHQPNYVSRSAVSTKGTSQIGKRGIVVGVLRLLAGGWA